VRVLVRRGKRRLLATTKTLRRALEMTLRAKVLVSALVNGRVAREDVPSQDEEYLEVLRACGEC
jgi:hypothetical protein